MMARSRRSNKRPDTLMQDRSPPTRRSSLATHGRTIHSGHFRTLQTVRVKSALPARTDIDPKGRRQICYYSADRRELAIDLDDFRGVKIGRLPGSNECKLV